MTGLDGLVEELFDYAGLFPPASLSFDEALKTSASFPSTLKRPRMVAADFVCPAGRLAELTPPRLEAAGFEPGRALKVCALGPPLWGSDAPEPSAQRAAAAAAVERGAVSYEVKCPADRLEARWIGLAYDAVRDGLGRRATGLFVEPDCASTEWPAAVERVLAFFDRLPESDRPGLKLRCSGPTAIDPDSLARLAAGACERSLRLKATAGLHHPLPEPRYGNRLGFLGLALAVRLRRSLGPGFSQALMRACFVEDDPRRFSFETGASWLEFRLSPEQLARRPSFTVGSCSLHEPDDDLQRLFPDPLL